jgi:hypothetical protein
MDGSAFYDAGPLKQLATNLFYGWGYDFYRKENQLRQDDQVIRAKADWLLGLSRAALAEAESDYRRIHLPSPTRAQPYPDPKAVEGAQHLERIGKSLEALMGRLHAAPVPENDRMTERRRQEAQTLRDLRACDEALIGRAELLRSLVQGQSAEEILNAASAISSGVAAIEASLQARQSLLC